MGTVFNQEPRFSSENRNYLFKNSEELIVNIKKLSEEHGITYMETLETIKFFYSIDNDDRKDEQISGMAKLFEEFIYKE